MVSDNSKYRHLTAGEAAILEVIDEDPDMEEWLESLRDSPFQQCETCQTLTWDSLTWFGRSFRSNWDEVKETAMSGCHTCRVLYFARMGTRRRNGIQVTQPPGPIKLRRSGSLLEAGWEGSSTIYCGTGVMPDVPSEDLDDGFNKQMTSRFVEDDPSSDNAFALAGDWISHCLTNHEYCLKNCDVELPTRVVDISEYKTTGRASLFVTEGAKSTYFALSHCWGRDPPKDGLIRRCTMKNFEELKAGFSVSMLPKTFQDAILVADRLGVQYIWIDSLCIIQDLHSDWSHESEQMSRVYGSSHVTIHGSAASNSDAGFLQCRPPNRYVRTKLCRAPGISDHWVWVQWPSSELVWDLEDSVGPLWDRAWAFQELVLPPRIVEYSPVQMNFRCNAQHCEETSRFFGNGCHDGYKELLWILSRPDVINSPCLERRHEAYIGSGTRMTCQERWYELVEGYAGRKLTFENNKLPAIAGVAGKIRQLTGDTYMAGLWKHDLATGLCWGRRSQAYLKAPSEYVAPSWSWASTLGHVSVCMPKGRKLHVDLIDWKLETDPLNALGEVFRGSITIRAPARHLDVSKDTVHPSEEWDYDASKIVVELKSTGNRAKSYDTHLFPLDDQEQVRDSRVGGICAVSFDMEPAGDLKEVLLVDLKAEGCSMKLEKPSNGFKPEGIVLQTVPAEGSEVSVEVVYKRIGIWGRCHAMAEWLEEGEEAAVLQGWTRTKITIM
ncbi:heterokaryon incompatibility protein-domain-containing protein [Clohesyomyces aquaticus]|uniref:Heterokaryon incompatibility protein-domain-containing protein n=1 Tax=Clohesyomyces aquaticus TaxID=1231657 RepID=A0A1Y1ZQH0_9PLEO|nr:heterokaryon incompatibility protein-domain-containing protein [Clohesyomyces aquaticus]